MAEEKNPAEQLKDEGNIFFGKAQYKEAIAKYSEAIVLDDTNAVYWCNRAFANLKSENFGATITDATVSLERNPRHVKALFHRGTAHFILGHLEESLKDFLAVCKLQQFTFVQR